MLKCPPIVNIFDSVYLKGQTVLFELTLGLPLNINNYDEAK